MKIDFKKKTNSIERLIDDFEDKISKCDNRDLMDKAIEISDDITFARLDFKQEKAHATFIDKLNGLNARYDDLKLSFETKCKCK